MHPPPTRLRTITSRVKLSLLASLFARLIQLLDTTDGLVKTTTFAPYVAIALRLDPFEILAHAY